MKQMARRKAAATATIARFVGQPVVMGQTDCGKVSSFAARQMGVSPRLAKAGSYSSEAGALRALRRMGAETLPDLLDQRFARIGFARALPADLIALECASPIGALAVVTEAGALRAFACLEGGVWDVVAPHRIVGCWRMPWKP